MCQPGTDSSSASSASRISTIVSPSSSSNSSKHMPPSGPPPWFQRMNTVRSAGYSVRPNSMNSSRLSGLPIEAWPTSSTLSKPPSEITTRLRVPPSRSSSSHVSAPPASTTTLVSAPVSASAISYRS